MTNLQEVVQLLEGVQRRATELLPELKDMKYEDRVKALKLPSLMYRRLRGDLIETFKFRNQMYAVNSNILLPTFGCRITNQRK